MLYFSVLAYYEDLPKLEAFGSIPALTGHGGKCKF